MRRLFLALCLLSVSFVSAHALQNLGAIRYDIRYQINDTTDTSHTTKYSDSFLNARINQVQREVCRYTFAIYSSQLISAVTAQQLYSVSTDTAKIDKVVFLQTSSTTSYKKLQFSSIQSLDNDKGIMWEQLPQSLPTNYFEMGNTIGLVPAPAGSYSVANAIKVYYYQIPADMVYDTDLPYNSISYLQDYSNAIVQGVIYKCKKEKGAASADDFTLYQGIINQMKQDMNNMRPDNSTIPINRGN